MEDFIYWKQTKMYNPLEHSPKVIVYGAGSIGSHVVMGLAKIGITDITVIDFDKVEPENIPAQFYPYKSDGFKVEVLASMVKQMVGTEIKPIIERIGDTYEPELSAGSIHILAFDNIEARKIVANKVAGFPVYLIDGRIGGFNYEMYALKANSDKGMEAYLKTLEGGFSELECGNKTLWAVNSLIASKIIVRVIHIQKGYKIRFSEIGNLETIMIISKEAVE